MFCDQQSVNIPFNDCCNNLLSLVRITPRFGRYTDAPFNIEIFPKPDFDARRESVFPMRWQREKTFADHMHKLAEQLTDASLGNFSYAAYLKGTNALNREALLMSGPCYEFGLHKAGIIMGCLVDELVKNRLVAPAEGEKLYRFIERALTEEARADADRTIRLLCTHLYPACSRG